MPDPPIDIDLSVADGPWPGILLGGTMTPDIAGTELHYAGFSAGKVLYSEGALSGVPLTGDFVIAIWIGSPTNNWRLQAYSNSSLVATWYSAEAVEFPYLVETWSAGIGATGAPTMARSSSPPLAVSFPETTVAYATMSTALTGTNNDLDFTAVPPGLLGNLIFVEYLNPGTNNAALSVSVSGLTVSVHLATNGSAVITSTAAQVKAAIEASADASALVTVAHKSGNNGSGVVTAMAAQDLADGVGGMPYPPVTIDL